MPAVLDDVAKVLSEVAGVGLMALKVVIDPEESEAVILISIAEDSLVLDAVLVEQSSEEGIAMDSLRTRSRTSSSAQSCPSGDND